MVSTDILITAVQQHWAIHAIWLTCHCLETIKTTDSHTLRFNNCQVYSAYFVELFNAGTVCVPKKCIIEQETLFIVAIPLGFENCSNLARWQKTTKERHVKTLDRIYLAEIASVPLCQKVFDPSVEKFAITCG